MTTEANPNQISLLALRIWENRRERGWKGGVLTPNGVSQPVNRFTGASKFKKHLCWISAASSLPIPPDKGASCTTMHLPVLLTLLTTVSI